jgi:VanZ family protein
MYLIYFFSSSSQPLFSLPQVSNSDKLLHFLEYIPLAFLWYIFLSSYNVKSHYKLAFLFSFIYAILDELHQYYVPNRMSDVNDILFDLIGILIGLKLAKLLQWRILKLLKD